MHLQHIRPGKKTTKQNKFSMFLVWISVTKKERASGQSFLLFLEIFGQMLSNEMLNNNYCYYYCSGISMEMTEL